MTSPIDIQPFLDKEGRLKIWPARKRRGHQVAVLAWLAGAFEMDRKYRENEVNEILKSHMSYGDFVLIRRELFEAKLLDRTLDGREYWLRPSGLSISEESEVEDTLSNPSPQPSPFEVEEESAL